MKRLRACLLAAVLVPLGASADRLVVAQVAPLSGPESAQGRAYAAGLRLGFDEVQRAGGVNGHTLALVQKDDGGRADDTVALTRAVLAEHKPVVLAGYYGGANVSALVGSGVLADEGVALVGYRTAEIGADAPQLFSVRATLREEIARMVGHLATTHVLRLGLLQEDGPGAKELMQVVRDAVAKAGGTLVAAGLYPAGTAKINGAVATLAAARPQAVLIVASGAAAAAFIERYRQEDAAAQLFAFSGTDIEQLSRQLGEEQMQGLVIAQVVPNPYKVSTARVTQQLRDALARAGKGEAVSYAMLEGFITAKVVAEAVRRAGARPTRAAVMHALETLKVDVGGYLVNFHPGERAGSRFVDLSIVSGAGRLRQ